MKTCPICKARCFDDMGICYGCLYRFDRQEAESVAVPVVEDADPDEPTVPFTPVSDSSCRCADGCNGQAQAAAGASGELPSLSLSLDDAKGALDGAASFRLNRVGPVSPEQAGVPVTLNIPFASPGWDLSGEGYRLVLDVRFEPLPSEGESLPVSPKAAAGCNRRQDTAGAVPRQADSKALQPDAARASSGNETRADVAKQKEAKPRPSQVPDVKAPVEAAAKGSPTASESAPAASAGKKRRRRRRSRKTPAPAA